MSTKDENKTICFETMEWPESKTSGTLSSCFERWLAKCQEPQDCQQSVLYLFFNHHFHYCPIYRFQYVRKDCSRVVTVMALEKVCIGVLLATSIFNGEVIVGEFN